MRDLRSHPEAPETTRVGADVFAGVRERYVAEDGRLVGYGRMAQWYSPFVHRELPGEVAKLRQADDAEIVSFAGTYGELDYTAFAAGDPQIDLGVGEIGKDPLDWIRAHASGVYICLSLTEALTRRMPTPKLEALLASFDNVTYAVQALPRQVSLRWQPARTPRLDDPRLAARHLRAGIINANLTGISRYVAVTDDGKDRSFFGYMGRASVLYWHLANMIDGGIAKRCEAAGCGAFFIQSDPRQRYCPRRWQQLESSCAVRQRQRDNRKGR
jgi:hypothetical protein